MYQVKQSGQNYSVVETRTQQVVAKKPSYREARTFARTLTSGAAFNGFTPAFFVSNTAPDNIWNTIDL